MCSLKCGWKCIHLILFHNVYRLDLFAIGVLAYFLNFCIDKVYFCYQYKQVNTKNVMTMGEYDSHEY